jgi:hypothetical protein
MDNALQHFRRARLDQAADALRRNNFQARVTDTAEEARQVVLSTIIPSLDPAPRIVSWGGSMSLAATGLMDDLRASDIEAINGFDKSLPYEENIERRRQALLSDLYFTGTNAVTEAGQLVNLDMIGNRVAAMTFGPRHVVVVAGYNKLTPTLDEAMCRTKDLAAPPNAMRLDKKTPCVKTARCEDCSSPDRICNMWTIHEKCFPKGRIHVVLVNQDLGL